MFGPFGFLLSMASVKLVFLPLTWDQIPNEDWEKWLVNDGFKNAPENDSSKSHLVNELRRLKTKFRNDIVEHKALVHDNGIALSPIEIINLVTAHKNRIDKVRLMMEHDLSIVKNYHKRNKAHYVIVRAYWIDNNGKKFRKFVKNLGNADKVYTNKKLSTEMTQKVEMEIGKMMWEQYLKDYPE